MEIRWYPLIPTHRKNLEFKTTRLREGTCDLGGKVEETQPVSEEPDLGAISLLPSDTVYSFYKA